MSARKQHFFYILKASVYRGYSLHYEKKRNFFCILFGSKKNNALYLLQ